MLNNREKCSIIRHQKRINPLSLPHSTPILKRKDGINIQHTHSTITELRKKKKKTMNTAVIIPKLLLSKAKADVKKRLHPRFESRAKKRNYPNMRPNHTEVPPITTTTTTTTICLSIPSQQQCMGAPP
ncbi:uncharacterized protein TM35_000611110 [Trypanosoma theileri]|uniref:Uncharacterized protein n=1 Tax=Trypanosoma theileri TaxID=67003 RepID=A0A1X0NG32_9TRYP|nr:uncharacterized protein TM35_000611110 [Trypanosoma theileri]ORC83666.1 hypothetical protein TM35_000611110 [Trypanosoma theileri]